MSLTALFTDIANAIRAKDGTTANIAASSFPERIGTIQTGTDTGDATATAEDILAGKTAYAKGAKVTGAIPTQAAATITPGTAAKTAVAAGRYTVGDVKVAGDANLSAWNIRKGASIFGVTGEFTTINDVAVLEEVYVSKNATTVTFQLPDDIDPENVFGIALSETRPSSGSEVWWWAMKGDVWYGCADAASGGKVYVDENVTIDGENVTMLLCYDTTLSSSKCLYPYVFFY